MTDKNESTADLKSITPEQLFALGAQDLAYVRPLDRQGESGFAVCAADGTEIGAFADRQVAFAACRQHGLEPVSVH